MFRKLFVILILFTMHVAVIKADDSMPIIAYMGVPNTKTSDANFKDFRDCGFDVSLYGYSSLNQLIEACRVADRNGVKVLGHCPETHDLPEHSASILMNEKGFFGYVLQDEPSGERIIELDKEIRKLKSVDDKHCFYINLLPFYTDWILKLTKTKTYEDYLKTATATSCRQISFDHYPVTHKGLRKDWYYNLEMVRNESLRTKKPFWGFVLSVPHSEYPQPTLATLRLQAYTNLAYGAQAIQYFTYWTPKPTSKWDFHNGPISQDGKKTDTYYLVQNMNKELRPIADLFYKAEVTSVNHLARVPAHTKRMTSMPANITNLKTDGAQGAIVSQFKKNGKHYMAVVNKDYLNPMNLYIKTKNGVVKINKDLTEVTPADTYKVDAGDIILFRLK